jgi:N-acetylneuraminate synthase
MSIEFIAEISSNHNQNLDRAREMIRVAAEIGCTAVKFQLFRIDKLFAPDILNNPSFGFINQRYEWQLPLDWLSPIQACCRANGVKFGCTPFYLEAVDILAPYVDFFKIASYELPWTALLDHIMDTTVKPIILSTGMATMAEIRDVVYHFQRRNIDNGCHLSLLHCISEYPVKPEDCHLSFIGRLRTELNSLAAVGWSDHSVNPGVINRAVHRFGAQIIEFHLDLDRKGYEYKGGHCWLPNEIKTVIDDINDGFEADGGRQYNPVGNIEREFRADPSDGLRPSKAKRRALQK